MRVIAGTAKGVALDQVPSGIARASLGRVRESLFAHLGDRVGEARVLDLFAGTGALGIEALSRGARSAVFVDNSRDSERVLRANLARARLADRARIVIHNALTVFRKGALSDASFNLVFVDPPYSLVRDARLGPRFVRLLLDCARHPGFEPGGQVVVKIEADLRAAVAPEGLRAVFERRYRNAEVVIFESSGGNAG